MSQTLISSFQNWLRNSLMARLIFIVVISLLLLIPLSMVQELIREREHRSQDVIYEIGQKWGGSQTVTGPFLYIPVERVVNGNISTSHIVVLPTSIDQQAMIEVEERKRGIYSVPLYRSDISVSGVIDVNDIGKSVADYNAAIKWDQAKILMHVSDEKGLRSNPELVVNGKTMNFDTRVSTNFRSGYSLAADIDLDSIPLQFDGSIQLNGTHSLSFLPIGSTTNASISSNWAHPKYIGDYITSENPEITGESSTASWTILEINRVFAREFVDNVNNIRNEFGIELLQPVDNYSLTTRSTKYGVLTIVMTFIVFLVVQLVTKLRVNSIQYIMVGFGLVLFYLLLISFSEQIGFNAAYLLSSIMIISLIGWYGGSIYRSAGPTIALVGTLGITYGFLYVVLQMEDTSLIMGSVLLFIALAVLMYFTRKRGLSYGDEKVIEE